MRTLQSKAGKTAENRGRAQSAAAVVGGAASALLGLFGLISWSVNLPSLTRVGAGFVPVAPESAFACVLLGLAVCCLPSTPENRRSFVIALSTAIVALVLGCINLTELLAGMRFGLEETVFPQLVGFRPNSHTRASPVSVIGQIMLAAQCLSLLVAARRRVTRVMPALTLCVGLVNFVVLLGYLYNTPILYGGPIRPVSLLTAVAYLFLVLGTIAAAGPEFFPLRLLAGSSVTSNLLRSFLPITFFVVLLDEILSDFVRWRVGSPHLLLEALQTLTSASLVTLVVLQVARAAGKRIDTAEQAREKAEREMRGAHEALEQRVIQRTAELGDVNRELTLEISERRTAQEALRQSEEKNRALIRAIPDWMLRIHKNGRIIDVKGPQSYFTSEATADPPAQRLAGNLLRCILRQRPDCLQEVLAAHEPQVFEFQYPGKEGTRHLEARMVRVGQDELLALIRDITENKELENEIAEIRTREQQRIGQELHDGLGQRLTAIGFLAKSLEYKLASKTIHEAAEAAKIGSLVAEAVSETRRLAKGLIPLELEGNDLSSALQDLAVNLARFCSTAVSFDSVGSVRFTDPAVPRQLFRIAQEAVNNALKHASPQRVDITLEGQPGAVTLIIRDNGVGFTHGVAPPKGLGLQIMQYRAKRIGARLSFETPPTGGTTVTCTVPHNSEPSWTS